MFKSEKIDSLFNCSFCSKLLHEPVFLPCGETMCKNHSKEISKKECQFCSENHTIPKSGFTINKIVMKQLESKLNTMNINFSQFNDSKKILQDLNKGLREIESIKNDPANYIWEYFKELNRQVDIRRENIIQETERYSNELIQNIEIIHKECLAKVTTKNKTTDCIEDCKAKLQELNGMFETFEIDDTKHEEIMSQKRTKELQKLMEPLVSEYKRDLLCNKSYKLSTSDFKIDKVFGSLSSSDDLKVIKFL